jgi:hypothetical protein
VNVWSILDLFPTIPDAQWSHRPQVDQQGLEQSLGNLGHADHECAGDGSNNKLLHKAHLFLLSAAAINASRMIRLQQTYWVTLQPTIIKNDKAPISEKYDARGRTKTVLGPELLRF